MITKLSKSAYATLKGVSPGRVSQWIAAKQIGPEAIDGAGQRAHIIVAIADEHLRQRLDVSQRFGRNGLDTNLGATPAPAAAPAALPPSEPPPAQQAELPEPADSIEARIKAEKLRQAELISERMTRESREASGIYIRADQSRAEMGRLAAAMMAEFEGSIQIIADQLSAQFSIPRRDLVIALRKSVTEWRSQAYDRVKAHASALPLTVRDSVQDDDQDIAAAIADDMETPAAE